MPQLITQKICSVARKLGLAFQMCSVVLMQGLRLSEFT